MPRLFGQTKVIIKKETILCMPNSFEVISVFLYDQKYSDKKIRIFEGSNDMISHRKVSLDRVLMQNLGKI